MRQPKPIDRTWSGSRKSRKSTEFRVFISRLPGNEMGLGKSIQAIGVINEDPTIRKAIIVCPASMRIPWRRKWSVG